MIDAVDSAAMRTLPLVLVHKGLYRDIRREIMRVVWEHLKIELTANTPLQHNVQKWQPVRPSRLHFARGDGHGEVIAQTTRDTIIYTIQLGTNGRDYLITNTQFETKQSYEKFEYAQESQVILQ